MAKGKETAKIGEYIGWRCKLPRWRNPPQLNIEWRVLYGLNVNKTISMSNNTITSLIDVQLESCENVYSCNSWPRMKCCGKTQGRFYCSECCTLFHANLWGDRVERKDMPFDIEVIRHDTNGQATGVQLGVLGVADVIEYAEKDEDEEAGADGESAYDSSSTFILFPSSNSVPITTVSGSIKKLLVFDCKWTKSVSLTSPKFKNLRHVKLSDPPKESKYWRWHNGEDGFLSTIEATVVALHEVMPSSKWANLLYIFGLQRAAIKKSCDDNGSPYPWLSDGYKREKRKQTKQKGSDRQKRQKEQSRAFSKEERQKTDKRYYRQMEAEEGDT